MIHRVIEGDLKKSKYIRVPERESVTSSFTTWSNST
jgi:hypothetical protein